MRLRDRVEKANQNIEILIDKIVNIERSKCDGYCVDYNRQKEGKCDTVSCENCREIYLEKIMEEMLEKYLV